MKGFPNSGEYVGAEEIFQHIFKVKNKIMGILMVDGGVV